jgi:hypothetical protein
MEIWNILRPFGIFYGHFGNLALIWYIFLRFGILYQEKSGNPEYLQTDINSDERTLKTRLQLAKLLHFYLRSVYTVRQTPN